MEHSKSFNIETVQILQCEEVQVLLYGTVQILQ
jgi:hypothetical protein